VGEGGGSSSHGLIRSLHSAGGFNRMLLAEFISPRLLRIAGRFWGGVGSGMEGDPSSRRAEKINHS